MDTTPLIARIKARTELRTVAGAMELAAALKAPSVATPAAFVVPMSDQPRDDEAFTGCVLQRVTSTVSVVLVLDSKRDATGAAAGDALQQLRHKVRQALLGWTPDGAEAPFTAGPGALIDFDNGRLWWGDQYQIQQLWSSDD